MPLHTLLLGVVAVASRAGMARAASYAIEPGTGDPVLWRAGEMQSSWPTSLKVGYVEEPPEDLTELVAYHIVWYASVDTSVWKCVRARARRAVCV